ncbi:transcription regulator, partial [Tanacetum coccineum]
TRLQGTSFLSDLKQKLLLSPSEAARAGTQYNVPLMNSLVLYVGMQVFTLSFPMLKEFRLEIQFELPSGMCVGEEVWVSIP